jgi:hypothetical protein
MPSSELSSRDVLPPPGVAARAGLASPTRAPWIVANGWRVQRTPQGKFAYDAAPGKAALEAAEAYAYGADAAITPDAADLDALGTMLTFLAAVPTSDLPPIADVAVVDDGSTATAEVMNLLARRNLLFKPVTRPATDVRINIVVGSAAYPLTDAADPSAFALKVRHQLTDQARAIRVYGSEVVVCRLTADAGHARLHVLNYGGRDIEGLRIRLRGTWREDAAYVSGLGRVTLADPSTTDGASEFSIPRLTTYAVIDLRAAER